MRAGRLLVSVDMLRMMLDLPEWCRITGVRPSSQLRGTMELCVEGKWMPEVLDGCEPPEVELLIHKINVGEPATTTLVGLDS